MQELLRIQSHISNSSNNTSSNSNSNGSGGGGNHHSKATVVRDCQILLHIYGSRDPFGAVAIDARTDKLSYVRQAIDKHFKEVMQLSEYVFLSKDGVEVQRSQEKEMLVCSQIYTKVGIHKYGKHHFRVIMIDMIDMIDMIK